MSIKYDLENNLFVPEYTLTRCYQILGAHGVVLDPTNPELDLFCDYFFDNAQRWGGRDLLTEASLRAYLGYDD